MGGSGSSGYTPSTPKNSCATLVFQATLSSPQPAVLVKLKISEILAVELAPGGRSVHVLRRGGTIAGSLIAPQVARLINCINNGYEYTATVVKLDGGRCVVSIEAK